MVNLVLLRDLLNELKVYIQYYELDRRHEMRTSKNAKNKIHSTDKQVKAAEVPLDQDDPKVKHVLERFMVLKPAVL